MKIRINKEKYFNHQCPVIPKAVMDVFYSNLMLRTRHRIPEHIKKIDTIDIRVNQAYAGCSNFHFYVSFNGLPEIHQEIHLYEQSRWSIKNRDGKYVTEATHPRGEWLISFEDQLKLDVGQHKMREKIKAVWDRRKAKNKSSKLVKGLRAQWEHFIKLQTYFNYEAKIAQ